MVTEDHLA